jgi:N-carbamoylputrescine amidase
VGLFNVALLQMTDCGADLSASLSKGEEFCRRARAAGADLALFPEMWSVGMSFFDPAREGDRARWERLAVGPEDAYVRHFRRLAAELEMAVALTYLERWPGAPRNTVSVIDRRGRIVLTYAKVHTCEFDIESALTPGDDFPAAALDTAAGPVRVGAMICYDREFPESARVLMLRGAEVILTPNACTLDPNRIGQFRARAFENMCGVAMTNYAAPKNNGHSCAFDAASHTKPAVPGGDGEPRDTLIVEAGEREGVYLAPFDLEELRDYRRREAWGNAYRRPRCYAPLTSEEVEEPFIRPDATR